jgi:predicted amidophosphoribosyltransferase
MGILEEMLKEALYEGVVSCPACGTNMEPDYDVCPECEKPNPLRKMGMI